MVTVAASDSVMTSMKLNSLGFAKLGAGVTGVGLLGVARITASRVGELTHPLIESFPMH